MVLGESWWRAYPSYSPWSSAMGEISSEWVYIQSMYNSFLMQEKRQHPGDTTCTVLPNTSHFTELRATRRPRRAQTDDLSNPPTDPADPDDYHQPQCEVFIDSIASHTIPTSSNAPNGRGITRQYAVIFRSNDESEPRSLWVLICITFSSAS